MFFLQKSGLRLKNSFFVMSLSPYIFDSKLNLPWNQFKASMDLAKSEKDYEANMTNQVEKALNGCLVTAEIAKMVQNLETKNLDMVTNDFIDYFKHGLKMTQCTVKIEVENSNSLTLEEAGLEDKTISRFKSEAKTINEEESEELPQEIRELSKHAITGASVLSPTKGKEIPNLRVGDRIKVHITDTSQRGRNIIKVIGAESTDGALKPIPATIRFIQKMQNGVWLILVHVGQELMVRIEEETDNIRVAVVDAPQVNAKENPKVEGNLGIMLGLGLGLIILIVAILIFVFL
jgi:hypothetical protein